MAGGRVADCLTDASDDNDDVDEVADENNYTNFIPLP